MEDVKRFSQEEIAFKKTDEFLQVKLLRGVFLVFAAFFGLFALTDMHYFPDHIVLMLILRFGIMIPIFIAIIILSYTKIFIKIYQRIILIAFVMGGMSINIMIILSPDNIIYYGGLFLVYFSGYLIVKLRYYPALFGGWTIFFSYFIGTIVYHKEITDHFLYGSLFFIGANIIGMFGAYNIETNNRKQFQYNQRILSINEELSFQYQEKIQKVEELETMLLKNRALTNQNIEKDKLNLELQKTQMMLNGSLESFVGFMIFAIDLEYRYLYFNLSHKKQVLEEVNQTIDIGTSIIDLMEDQTRKDNMKTRFDRAFKGKNDMYLEIHQRDAKTYYEAFFNPLYDANNEIVGATVFARDVTERIKAEEEIKEHTRMKSLLLSNLPGVAFRCKYDEVWTMLFLSDAFYALTGYHPNEVIDNKELTYNDIIAEEHRLHIAEEYKQAMLTNTHCNIEYEILTAKGERKWVWEKGIVVQAKDDELLVEGFIMDITPQKIRQDEITYISYHDFLTSIPNRRYFQEKLEYLDHKDHFPLAVIIMDLNGLKVINDAFGHTAGNIALKQVAVILQEVKTQDGIVARIGGDEFAMLIPKCTNQCTESIVETIHQKIAQNKVEGIEYSLAIGYEIKSNKAQSIRDILRNAENLMYKNKVIAGASMRNKAIMGILGTLLEKYLIEKIHSDQVGSYCKAIGKALKLKKDAINELELAGKLHDIGKISIPDKILDKADVLSPEEWDIMRNHTMNGYQILRAADEYSDLAAYAMTHHERIDGNGYPNGLKGKEIPLFSRIITVADAYEAMTSDRPYRKALSKKTAINELKKHAGTQFDEKIVKVFIEEVIEKKQV